MDVTDGSVNISFCNFVGKGIMISVSFTNNMRDITSGIGTAVPSGAPEFTQFLVWVCVAQSLILNIL
jgi:hypothetical protein